MIKIVASGWFTSIQDKGRFGFRKFGVPVSGAMDQTAAENVNKLVGNPKESALLEFTASGPILLFEKDAMVACAGAPFIPKVDGIEKLQNKPFFIRAGEVLSFQTPSKGVRGYLAVHGGIQSPEKLGSRSSYEGISSFVQLKKGHEVPIPTLPRTISLPITSEEIKTNYETPVLQVRRGPEFDLLSETIQTRLISGSFRVGADSNRMAYSLEHPLDISAKEIITAPVQPGTVQLTPSGSLLVLMRDAQTTGGYARVFQLTQAAINLLSQKRAGSAIQFKIIDPLF